MYADYKYHQTDSRSSDDGAFYSASEKSPEKEIMPWDSLDTYNVNSVLKTSKKEKNERNHAHGQRKKEYSSEIEQQASYSQNKRNSITQVTSDTKAEFKYVFPVDKPLHTISKKPLKRIPISFMDNEDDAKIPQPIKKPKNVLPDWINAPKSHSPDKLNEKENQRTSLLERKENQSSNSVQPEAVALKRKISIEETVNKDFKYVFPINKKTHLQSKKPLKKVPITFV